MADKKITLTGLSRFLRDLKDYTIAFVNTSNSSAEMKTCSANGSYSVAEGFVTRAEGSYSHTEGYQTRAVSIASHAEGSQAIAEGSASHAEGYQTLAKGSASHVEGFKELGDGITYTLTGSGTDYVYGYNGPNQPIVGTLLKRDSLYAVVTSFSEETSQITTDVSLGTLSNAEVLCAGGVAFGIASHLEGIGCVSYGVGSHAEGMHACAFGDFSHAEGAYTYADGGHAEGYQTVASSENSHAEGEGTTASNRNSHAEGNHTTASGENSHAEGYNTTASYAYTHAEGNYTTASGYAAHAEGQKTYAEGSYSHAEGSGNAVGTLFDTLVDITGNGPTYTTGWGGENSRLLRPGNLVGYGGVFAKVVSTTSTTITLDRSLGNFSTTVYLEEYSYAGGDYSHVEGAGTTTDLHSLASHAEGFGTIAKDDAAHAEGWETLAEGVASHAEGRNTYTTNSFEHAEGEYNYSHQSNNSSQATIHSVGIGGSSSARTNAIEIMKNGDMYIYGIGGYTGSNISTASTLQDILSSPSDPVAITNSEIDTILAS